MHDISAICNLIIGHGRDQKEDSPSNPQLDIHTSIREITMHELFSALLSVYGQGVFVSHTPFPHIVLPTSFGQVIFTDNLKGYVRDNDNMNHIALRCTFNGPDASSYGIRFQPSLDSPFEVLSRKPYLSLKTVIILRFESIDNLLGRVHEVILQCQAIYQK